jgi:RNA polymerase sigma factor (sigma-70 family)
MMPSDSDLVRRCLDGEEQAWRVLTERYADLVHAVARRSGLDGDGAADVVQEVFLTLLTSLARLRRRDRLVGWIAQTARRESWRQARRERAAARRAREAARPEAAPAPLPDAALAELEAQQTVRQAYGALGERCRRLLDLLFVTGTDLAYAEVATRLRVPVGSIGPTRRRCLDALRRELEALGFPLDGVARRRSRRA